MSEDLLWDAGDTGCGELIVQLKLRLRAEVPAGGTLRLIATDPGAREDIPSWCRLTGNPLLHADHPQYLIQRKQEKQS